MVKDIPWLSLKLRKPKLEPKINLKLDIMKLNLLLLPVSTNCFIDS